MLVRSLVSLRRAMIIAAGFGVFIALPSWSDELPGGAGILIHDIVVDGPALLPGEVVDELVRRYRNRETRSDELLDLAREITTALIERGFVNSGAIVPDQQVRDGIVHLEIVSGSVERVEITGNRWLSDDYIRSRIATGGAPFNINTAVASLQLLERDPHVRRLNAELKPAAERGQAILEVRVDEQRPYGASIAVDDYISPNVGGYEAVIDAYHLSVFGHGDAMTMNYRRAEGFSGFFAHYAFPLNARNTAVSVAFERDDSRVVSEPFTDLDIEGDMTRYAIALRHPVILTLTTEWSVEIGYERERVRSFLLGELFSFSPTNNGISEFNVAHLSQDFVRRGADRVLAAHLGFNAGEEASQDAGARTRFLLTIVQGEWLEKLAWLDSTLGLRAQAQFANEPLPAHRKYTLGGAHSVRGHRENLYTRDNGFAATIEWTVPIGRWQLPWLQDAGAVGGGEIVLGPFVDYGRGWNDASGLSDSVELASAGLGVEWRIAKNTGAELHWAAALTDYKLPGAPRVLQDEGVHFSVRVGF